MTKGFFKWLDNRPLWMQYAFFISIIAILVLFSVWLDFAIFKLKMQWANS